ncbi:MAG: pyridoxamine 5'-phosphate oxidase family protein [Bacteroidaceae bacterium]|nr:pyridoxamine 5'-phosphate oxidase family protein [Bacteroidaceae bacterium]
MKKILFAMALLLTMVACTNNKPAEAATETPETSVEEADTVSEQTKQQNMEEVQAFLKECNAFFIATVDGDQPHVRPFGVSEIIDGRLYIMTGKVKDVYKQMAANGKFEICALKPSGSEWIRITGTLVNDDALAVKTEFLERNPSLKSMYKADDDNIAVLYITQGSARFCSFSAPERKVKF